MAPPKHQRALLAHSLQEMEGWGTPYQEGDVGAPPEKQSALFAQDLQEGGRGGSNHQRPLTARRSGREGGNQGMADRTGKKKWGTAPIRG